MCLQFYLICKNDTPRSRIHPNQKQRNDGGANLKSKQQYGLLLL